MSATLGQDDVSAVYRETIGDLALKLAEAKNEGSYKFVQHIADELDLDEKSTDALILSLVSAAERTKDDLITVVGCVLMGFRLGERAASKS